MTAATTQVKTLDPRSEVSNTLLRCCGDSPLKTAVSGDAAKSHRRHRPFEPQWVHHPGLPMAPGRAAGSKLDRDKASWRGSNTAAPQQSFAREHHRPVISHETAQMARKKTMPGANLPAGQSQTRAPRLKLARPASFIALRRPLAERPDTRPGSLHFPGHCRQAQAILTLHEAMIPRRPCPPRVAKRSPLTGRTRTFFCETHCPGKRAAKTPSAGAPDPAPQDRLGPLGGALYAPPRLQ